MDTLLRSSDDATGARGSGAPPSRLRIAGMDCASCGAKIETAIRRLPGVENVSVSVPARTVTVAHAGTVSRAALCVVVTSLGYAVSDAGAASSPLDAQGADPAGRAVSSGEIPWWRSGRGLLALACGAALAVAYVVGRVLPASGSYVFLAALAVGLVPVARRAVAAARFGTPFSIETLMTVAAIGAAIIGAAEEAATVVFLFLVGELLEGVAAGRARASINALSRLVPRTALLETDGRLEEVPANALKVGATVLVRPGDRIPADGVVTDGEGAVDEAPVTGESVPKPKARGDKVFAGTINGDGALRIRATATAQDNTIARVVRLVEEAQAAKAPTERIIDRFARHYTPGIVAVAAAVAVLPPLLFGASWAEWVYRGLAVLLVGCPCALVISTPAAIAAGLSVGARRGLLIKGGAPLENLGRVTVAAFDKTGTLTEGRPQVTDVVPLDRSEREVLSLAAALETGSAHPLAKAILATAAEAGVPIPLAAGARSVGGQGVTGRVGGVELFLGSPRATAERVPLTPELEARAAALNAEGKTVAVLLAPGMAGDRLEAVAPTVVRVDPRVVDSDRSDPGSQAFADLLVDRMRGRSASGPRRIVEQRVRSTFSDEPDEALLDEMRMQGHIAPAACLHGACFGRDA